MLKILVNYTYLIILLPVISLSCQSKKDTREAISEDKNPAAAGFDLAGSDKKAIEIADEVMEAMGGRENWDKTRYFTWNFFGARTLWWDKVSGDVRVESHRGDGIVVVLNIFDDTGRVACDGMEYVHADSVAKYVKRGKHGG